MSKQVAWDPRLVARFFAKAEEDTATGCWNWTALKDKKGYGRFEYATKDQRLAYAVSYGLLISEVPVGLQLDHLCRNTSCVNPYHLEPVTGAVNMARAAAVKTACPSGHPYSDENTYLSPKGARVCRTCRAKSQRADKERRKVERRARGPLPRQRPAECKHGHPFDEVNTYVYNDVFHCRACRAKRERDRKAAQRASL